MFEHTLQMGPMLVLAGLMAGWVADTVSRAEDYGFLHDMVLGPSSGVVVATVWVVTSREAGMLAMFLIGCGGAALAIIAHRLGLFHFSDDPSFSSRAEGGLGVQR